MDNDFLLKAQKLTSAYAHVATWMDWVARAIEIGWLDRTELDELLMHLRTGRDFCIEELRFEHIDGQVRVSFRDEGVTSPPSLVLHALHSLASGGV